MARFFNNNNVTVNNSQETEQQSNNKLGWLKTGALIIGGIGASVGAAIGAKKLYEKFFDLDGELDSANYPEESETESDVVFGSSESDSVTPNNSEVIEAKTVNFNEVDTEPTIFTTAKETVDETPEAPSASEEPMDVVPGTIDSHDGSYVLPEGKTWKDLVRSELFDIFKELESRFNNLDFSDSVYVVRSAASVFERAENMPSITDWEQVWIDSMYKDLDAYVLHAMVNIEERHKETQNTDDIILANRLYDEFVNSPMYTFKVGKKLRDILDVITKNPVERDPRTGKSIPTFGLPMLEAYMHNAYMHYSKLDTEFFKNSDPRYVAKVFYSNMDRILATNPKDSKVLDTENGILVPFSVVAVELYNGLTVNLEVDLQSDPGNKSIINRIFELQTEAHEFYDDLMAHYGNNESYLETIIENPFNGTEDTVKVILKSLMDEMDARCKNLRSEEQNEGSSGEAVAVAAENETAATTEAPVVKEELSESSAADNTAALEKFRKDIDFLNGLLDAARMSDAQKFFRENLASYITDPNVSEETRNGLAQIQEKITNFLIAEKQAAAIEEANNCSRRSSRKKGGKKNYKKNGRK